jgi:hypothetical protein
VAPYPARRHFEAALEAVFAEREFKVLWVLMARPRRPDAVVWRGRRMLAALDAVAWPLLAALVLLSLPQPGNAGLVALAACALTAVHRLLRAVLRNERYFFTTWRWGRLLAGLLVFGYALQGVAWMAGRGALSG